MHAKSHNPPSGSAKKYHQNHGRRRPSTSFDTQGADTGFGAFPDDPFAAPITTSHSRGKKGSASRRNSTDGSARGDTVGFGGSDPFASFASSTGSSKPSRSRRKSMNGADDFASFDAFGNAPTPKSKPAPPAPMVPAPAPTSSSNAVVSQTQAMAQICRGCHQAPERACHIIQECHGYDNLRRKHFGTPSLPSDKPSWDPSQMQGFLREPTILHLEDPEEDQN